MKARLPFAIVALGAILAVSAPAKADPFVFDPTGGGGGTLTNTLDYLPGNALAVGAIASFTAPAVPFTTLFQARLGAVTAPGGGDITPGGLNSTFEITIVARFLEMVSGAIPGSPVNAIGRTATFAVVPSPTNYVEMWWDPGTPLPPLAPDASDLYGTGFNDLIAAPSPGAPPPVAGPAPMGAVDGGSILIMSGLITSGIGNFTVGDADGDFGPDGVFGTADDAIEVFDQTGIDNYVGNPPGPAPTQLTLEGTGSTSVSASVLFAHPLFFPGFVPGAFNLTFFNTSQVLPFRQAEPSSRFVFAAGGALPVIAGAGAGTLGTVNGAGPADNFTPFVEVVGTDFQFQTDANQTFRIQQNLVPEPSTLVLSVVGLSAMGLRGLVRRRRQAAMV